MRVTPTLADIPASQWNDLARTSGFYMSHAWLKDIETHPDSDTCYIMVEEPCGRLAMAMPVHRVRDESNARYDARKVVPGADYPEFVLGSRRGYQSSLLVHQMSDELTRTRAGELLTADLSALLGDTVARMWFVPDDRTNEVANLGPGMDGRSVCVRPVDLEAWVPVGEGGLSQLFEEQPARRRANLRRERRVYLNQGYTTRIEPLAGMTGEAGALLAQLEGKYGSTRPVSERVAYYERLSAAEEPGEVVTCRRDGRLLGFCHYFVFGDAVWARSGGFDYENLNDAFEYFNVVIFELVEIAARRGVTGVHLGMESIDAKRRHGAVVKSLNLVTFDGMGVNL